MADYNASIALLQTPVLASRSGVAGVQTAATFVRLARARWRNAAPRNGQHVLQPLSHGGLGFALSQLRIFSPPACSPFPSPTLPCEPPLPSPR